MNTVQNEYCTSCGRKNENWRRPHSEKCSECGRPICRKCGIDVSNMENTSNGGLCIPCSQDVYGHEA